MKSVNKFIGILYDFFTSKKFGLVEMIIILLLGMSIGHYEYKKQLTKEVKQFYSTMEEVINNLTCVERKFVKIDF